MNSTIFYIVRITFFIITICLCLTYFFHNSLFSSLNAKETIGILISAISIIIAIIITYLFSKLFAEKSERIERKVEIDKLSHKVTSLRKIAFHIRGLHGFWKFGKTDVKSIMDYKYADLTYEEIRGDKFSYEELTAFFTEVGDSASQAYTAVKGLENNETAIGFFQKFNPTNYSLEEIGRFKEYVDSFWYLLDRSSDDFVNFNNANSYSLQYIDELFFDIKGIQIDKKQYNKEIKKLCTFFSAEVFEKLYYLTKLNTKAIPPLFLSSFSNMLIFIILLISSLIVYMSDFGNLTLYMLTTFIVSLFIANTIDLVIITTYAVKSELQIKDFYRI